MSAVFFFYIIVEALDNNIAALLLSHFQIQKKIKLLVDSLLILLCHVQIQSHVMNIVRRNQHSGHLGLRNFIIQIQIPLLYTVDELIAVKLPQYCSQNIK